MIATKKLVKTSKTKIENDFDYIGVNADIMNEVISKASNYLILTKKGLKESPLSNFFLLSNFPIHQRALISPCI